MAGNKLKVDLLRNQTTEKGKWIGYLSIELTDAFNYCTRFDLWSLILSLLTWRVMQFFFFIVVDNAIEEWSQSTLDFGGVLSDINIYYRANITYPIGKSPIGMLS